MDPGDGLDYQVQQQIDQHVIGKLTDELQQDLRELQQDVKGLQQSYARDVSELKQELDEIR